MLLIISTPIGNLADLTYRAVEELRSCDYLLCEDTRHSRPLLQRYAIDCPLVSYHQHNERASSERAIEDLLKGLRIGLLTDAGTPSISDPGQKLIESCHAQGIRVSVIPGACAAICAIAGAGFAAEHFQFIGFLPRGEQARRAALQQALCYCGTTACYESPHRLNATLTLLCDLMPTAEIAIARELTKIHEEIRRGSASTIALHYAKEPPRGEICLVIAGGHPPPPPLLSPAEEVSRLQEEGLPLSAAVKKVATERNLNKRTLYREVHFREN